MSIRAAGTGSGHQPRTGPAELHELGERLESHIRHEERVLFPMIEEALPMEELEQLATAVERVDARRE
jgi:iron-sulfur cluster repair protein YtfE (RIC family)